jgi:AcrR family transcriptional regulator
MSTGSPSPPAPRSGPGEPRADARRNRARILDAARSAFAEDGIAIPLDEIARRAGVGPGTVYRHFPSKDALFASVIIDQVESLIAAARASDTTEDAGEAFYTFFAEMVERLSINKALFEAIEAGGEVPLSGRPQLHADFATSLAVVLERAQAAGSVRADIDAADTIALAVGAIAMERQRDAAGRMVTLVSDVFRPRPAARPVTRQPVRPVPPRGRAARRSDGPDTDGG